MPAPAIQLDFKRISATPGSYGPAWEERSRRGISGHRFYFIGNRGDRRQVRAVAYFTGQAAAEAAIANWESKQGKEVTLRSILDDKTWQVFLHRAVADIPRKVGSTEPNVTHQVTVTLDVQRTA